MKTVLFFGRVWKLLPEFWTTNRYYALGGLRGLGGVASWWGTPGWGNARVAGTVS